jgi:hypothetical protein
MYVLIGILGHFRPANPAELTRRPAKRACPKRIGKYIDLVNGVKAGISLPRT